METFKNVKNYLFTLGITLFLFNSCGKNQDIDQESPTIEFVLINNLTAQCAEVEKGKSFFIKARIEDNLAIGSYSIDIHDNFDQHSHSTDVVPCQHEEPKLAINPFVFVRSFEISEEKRALEIEQEIFIPDNVDVGDYHITLKVVDKLGWSKLQSFGIKIK